MKPQGIVFERDFIVVSGSDRLRFLQGMLSADIKRACLNGLYTCGRSFLLNAKGKIVSEILFFVDSTSGQTADNANIILSCTKGYGTTICEALDKLIIADDVALDLQPNLYKVYRLPGGITGSAEFKRVPSSVPSAQDVVFESTKMDATTWVLPCGLLGPGDCEVWAQGTFEIEALSQQMFHQKRIEVGVPLWGVDFTEESFLLEYPVKDAISFHKGCYIGQEVVARTTYRGHVVRAFAKFSLERNITEKDFLVLQDQPEKVVGKITTVVGDRALGLLRIDQAKLAIVTQQLKVPVNSIRFLIDVE